MTRIAIIGDVHGNGRALRAALTAAERVGFDRLVFVGDLLTYGHDVRAVLDLVGEAQARHRADLLVGNHDQMYFDIAAGDRRYVDGLPDWIRASVDLTLRDLSIESLRDRLRWTTELIIDDVLIAHAGPFGSGDWSYVNGQPEHERAARILSKRGLRAGVFGHTHRARWYIGDATSAVTDAPLDEPLRSPPEQVLVANAGAIGQPRDRRRRSVLLRLDVSRDELTGAFTAVEYDVDAHVAMLDALPLPDTTRERLRSFFRPTEG